MTDTYLFALCDEKLSKILDGVLHALCADPVWRNFEVVVVNQKLTKHRALSQAVRQVREIVLRNGKHAQLRAVPQLLRQLT